MEKSGKMLEKKKSMVCWANGTMDQVHQTNNQTQHHLIENTTTVTFN